MWNLNLRSFSDISMTEMGKLEILTLSFSLYPRFFEIKSYVNFERYLPKVKVRGCSEGSLMAASKNLFVLQLYSYIWILRMKKVNSLVDYFSVTGDVPKGLKENNIRLVNVGIFYHFQGIAIQLKSLLLF